MQQTDPVTLPNTRCHRAEINWQSCQLDCMKTVTRICLAVKYWTGENKINHVSKTSDKIKIQTNFSCEEYEVPELISTFFLVRSPKPWLALSAQIFFTVLRARSSLRTNNRIIFFQIGGWKQQMKRKSWVTTKQKDDTSLWANCFTWHVPRTHFFRPHHHTAS